ncbi:hypothetical protein [Pseudochryseolinea flava]|uniref:Uncharacterized protein n=1 Tax=Pseudochryseolinea flava TaxID=2059302 RepID=A0A364XUM0_9BACT|nr:hypothetical protein [Pseudochryseolinea flava]RAV97958.1 hypothetical protein DQQ10_26160 [Pseudochryseolinea flava]
MSEASTIKSHWLTDPVKEGWIIMVPSIVPVLGVLFFNNYFSTNTVSTLWWLILVVCIDVSHVYSTLFRMYWDKHTFDRYKSLLVIIPIISFAVGFAIHFYNDMIFWRVLAYIAVFHFIRQQYGFMRLYARKENNNRWIKWIDTVSIYNATIFPILYWHIHLTNQINWFVKDDFVALNFQHSEILIAVYIIIGATYVIKEGWLSLQRKQFNLPKNLIMIGTYASWYVGIVMFQGDLIFTFLNVVAHGIPYMGLVWLYGEKKATRNFNFGWKGVVIFLSVLILFAYFEEAIWDAWVWRDHEQVFSWLPTVMTPISNSWVLSIVVPLLVLPQITHYILDGFIWKFSSDARARI